MTLRVRFTEKFLRQSHCRDEEVNRENRNGVFTTKTPTVNLGDPSSRRIARKFLHEGLDKGVFELVKGRKG